MADWTTSKTWSVGDTVPAADMNTYLRDNTQYLYDNAVVLLDSYEVTTTNVGTITFDSISGDYTSLELRVRAAGGTSATTAYVNIRANNDSSTDSYRIVKWHNGGTNGPQNHSSFVYLMELTRDGYTPQAFSAFTCRIHGYSDTDCYTTLEGTYLTAYPVNIIGQLFTGYYLSYDNVTSLEIGVAGNFYPGSKISLYGYR